MSQQTSLELLQDHSERLLDLVEKAELEAVAEALKPMLEERDRLMGSLSEALAAGMHVAPDTREALEAMDRRIGTALARRREEARLALTALQRRPAPLRPTSPPPPRFLDQMG